MSVIAEPQTVLNHRAAEQVLEWLESIPETDREAIADCAESIIDFRYWYRKAAEAAVDADPETSEFLGKLSGRPGLYGPALATLTEPLVGHGVHRAQLDLLNAAHDSYGAAA
ncbi:hypothetical protein [Leifsonia sp. Leaf264]|uniref:hypothetical protein n=1 Tax=Leifsonia sp. Leaf264 TaxID=1736314 RepID=UPI000A84F4BA|nr:hypothetical protein [Leifsonia sp. Leaf264]